MGFNSGFKGLKFRTLTKAPMFLQNLQYKKGFNNLQISAVYELFSEVYKLFFKKKKI